MCRDRAARRGFRNRAFQRLISKVPSGVAQWPSDLQNAERLRGQEGIAALQLGVCKLGSTVSVSPKNNRGCCLSTSWARLPDNVYVDELGFEEWTEGFGHLEVRKQVGGVALEPRRELAGFRVRDESARIGVEP